MRFRLCATPATRCILYRVNQVLTGGAGAQRSAVNPAIVVEHSPESALAVDQQRLTRRVEAYFCRTGAGSPNSDGTLPRGSQRLLCGCAFGPALLSVRGNPNVCVSLCRLCLAVRGGYLLRHVAFVLFDARVVKGRKPATEGVYHKLSIIIRFLW
jgi:hypothetical protein